MKKKVVIEMKIKWFFKEESKATLLLNSAMCKNVSPVDIRKLMSIPKKKEPSNKIKKEKKILANKTKSL